MKPIDELAAVDEAQRALEIALFCKKQWVELETETLRLVLEKAQRPHD